MKTEITNDELCSRIELHAKTLDTDEAIALGYASVKRIRDLTRLLDDAYICINGCEAALAGLRVKHQAT